MSAKQVVVKKIINAPIEKVFDAFSKPEIMQNWFFPGQDWYAEISNKFEIGGSYSIKMYEPNGETYIHHGEYREIKRFEKMVFTWNSALVRESLVTVIFHKVEGGTEVTLTHELLPTDEIRDKHKRGWVGCFINLEQYLS